MQLQSVGKCVGGTEDQVDHQSLTKLLTQAENQKYSRTKRRKKSVVSFWGFCEGQRWHNLASAIAKTCQSAMIYGSEVADKRFECVICVSSIYLQRHVVGILNAAKMGAGHFEIMTFKSCNSKEGGEGLLACVGRIEQGKHMHGRHPSEWGGTFGGFMNAMNVQKVETLTGMRVSADNLLMLYTSLREASVQIESLQHDRSFLWNEVNRLWFEVQSGYRSGHVDINAFQRMMRQRVA